MTKNFQDLILNQVRRENSLITIFLVNGFKKTGFVKGFDNYVLVIETNNKENSLEMIYKHAISTIIPSSPLVGLNFNTQNE